MSGLCADCRAHDVEVAALKAQLAKAKALVDAATHYRFGSIGVQSWLDKWALNGTSNGRVVCEVFDTRDDAIARARELAGIQPG